MKSTFVRVLAGILAAAVVPLSVGAQNAPAAAQEQAAPQFAPEQLDQLLAPIALYPDQLLGQILMAATYPLEVVQADRWLKLPGNAALKGERLAAALAEIDWDPSVKSLVPFPQILAMMDQRLDWTQKLGDAFLAQQADVMDSVQRLRQQAQAAGTLQSTAQATVTPVGQTIVIVPANPQIVYVPVYNPTLVYGVWRYPAYPPYYFPPPAGFYVGPPVFSGIRFSIGFSVVSLFWGWDDWDWVHHRLHVDHDRYNVINHYFVQRQVRPAFDRDYWQHDPYHRRGVVYRDPPTREKFRAAPAGDREANRNFRGYNGNAAAVRPAPRPSVSSPSKPAVTTVRPTPQPSVKDPSKPAVTTVQPAAPRREDQPVAKGAAVQQPPAKTEQKPAKAANRAPTVAGAPRTPTRQPTVSHGPPPAFEGYAKGAEIRAQAERGRASTKAATKPEAAGKAPASAAPARNAPAPAGNKGGHGGARKPPDTGDKRSQ